MTGQIKTRHPLPNGTRVTHINQEWARRLPGGTATILDRQGPWPDGSWEYLVRTTGDFSRQPSPDNPESRTTWWPSYATTPATTNRIPMNDRTPATDSTEQEARSLHEFLTHGLTTFGGDAQQARITYGFSSLWAFSSPEVRRYLLLLVAWEARDTAANDNQYPSTAGQYAQAFTQYAAEWARQNPGSTADAFCTGQHSAYIAAGSLAFDRDDLEVSLETALLLSARAPQTGAGQ
ncbi:hypothetical protein [Streptomyces alanosinicus]|uniref:Uncharacterized protein n=1 Tax=Streptomyces alanosinicus TaxID=68171 RepID=A0A918YM50_9ACTN|nr:hypothetical protein [Streptomyces alanosinicus]GHE09203.1 hypothetical protein GCM10010339_60670 [Streptomyces alanosinicus]